MRCEYRVVSCDDCLWRDWYEIGRRPSYPPRCPACGSSCTHEFMEADFPLDQRLRLGMDEGERKIIGNPRYGDFGLAEHLRKWRRHW